MSRRRTHGRFDTLSTTVLRTTGARAGTVTRAFGLAIPLLFAMACGEGPDDGTIDPDDLIDADGDQFFENAPNARERDCDDNDPNTHPGADEVCDRRDNDCNGLEDDNALEALDWFPDFDDDGFASPIAEPEQFCFAPPGYTASKGDCNDRSDVIFPGAPELCDGLNNNCNDAIDEGLDTETDWWIDYDGDGYGAGEIVGNGCVNEPNWVSNALDCDDGLDSVSPDEPEICDGIDNDCDGLIDDGDPDDLIGAPLWYADQDFDTYGDIRNYLASCEEPNQDGIVWVRNSLDCAPEDPVVNPETEWWADEDGDGFGVAASPWPNGQQCWQPIGYAPNTLDCDDTNPLVSSVVPWFPDADGDGFGGPDPVAFGCNPDPGWSADNTDCDDRDDQININGLEVCDGVDNDCDGGADDLDPEQPVIDSTTFWQDNDGDGFGDPAAAVNFCVPPGDFVANSDDCNDDEAAFNPNTLWYADQDFDTYGDLQNPYINNPSCNLVPGHVLNTNDCDDTEFFQNDFTSWFLDLDQDGVGEGVEPTTCGCRYSDFLALDSGDCDPNDPLVTDNTCYGDPFGAILIEVAVDDDAADLAIRYECAGQGPVFTQEFVAGDAGADLAFAFAQESDTTCQLVVTDSSGDASGDGGPDIDIRICGVLVDSISHTGAFAAYGTYDTTRCSGCVDPLADNFNPNAVVEVPDTCFYLDNNICSE